MPDTRAHGVVALAAFVLMMATGCTRGMSPLPGNGEVAFINNFRIVLARPDGTDVRPLPLTTHDALVSTLAWSPDGTQLAFCCRRDATDRFFRGLAVVAPDGSELRTIADVQDAVGLTWSPDGREIAVQGTGDSGVHVFGVDGTLLMTVPSSDVGVIPKIVWSPRGGRMALLSADRLWVMSADGSDRTQVHPPAPELIDMAWSPDGTRLVFTACGSDGSGCGIYFANANGGDVSRVDPPGFPNMRPATDYTVDWSPLGDRILVAGRYVMNATGTTIIEAIARGTGSWSPDGTELLVQRIVHPDELSMAPRIYVDLLTTDPDGQHAEKVARTYGSDFPVASWEPLPTTTSSAPP